MKNDQVEKFVEALKFTPINCRIEMTGYGGEIVLGTIDKEKYQYLEDNGIDIEEYANDWDNELKVPENMQPFEPGSWHECDNIAHESGVEVCGSSWIRVVDENDNVIWENSLDVAELEEAGVQVSCVEEIYAMDQDVGTPVFIGQSGEKGLFFGGPFVLRSPFDPAKLSISCSDIEGWQLSNSVSYDDVDIDNEDYDTVGKSMDMSIVLVGS